MRIIPYNGGFMDLLFYLFENAINFFVASIPLIIYFLGSKLFKLTPKVIMIFLIINLIMSIYFWIKLKDIYLAIYQCIPYLLSYICLFAVYILVKRKNNNISDNSSEK